MGKLLRNVFLCSIIMFFTSYKVEAWTVPRADIKIKPTEKVGLTITVYFDGSKSTGECDAKIVSYYWTGFGTGAYDITRRYSAQASCKYKTTGTKTVSLRVDDEYGNIAIKSRYVYVYKPTDEITTFFGWGSGLWSTAANWLQQLQLTYVYFTGMQVTERDKGGGTDGCWFPGSDYSPYLTIPELGTWTVGNFNYWGYDEVGWDTVLVNYYRKESRKIPCGFKFYQAMDVVIPDGNIKYTDNILRGIIGTTTVGSERDGQSASKTWP